MLASSYVSLKGEKNMWIQLVETTLQSTIAKFPPLLPSPSPGKLPLLRNLGWNTICVYLWWRVPCDHVISGVSYENKVISDARSSTESNGCLKRIVCLRLSSQSFLNSYNVTAPPSRLLCLSIMVVILFDYNKVIYSCLSPH